MNIRKRLDALTGKDPQFTYGKSFRIWRSRTCWRLYCHCKPNNQSTASRTTCTARSRVLSTWWVTDGPSWSSGMCPSTDHVDSPTWGQTCMAFRPHCWATVWSRWSKKESSSDQMTTTSWRTGSAIEAATSGRFWPHCGISVLRWCPAVGRRRFRHRSSGAGNANDPAGAGSSWRKRWDLNPRMLPY